MSTSVFSMADQDRQQRVGLPRHPDARPPTAAHNSRSQSASSTNHYHSRSSASNPDTNIRDKPRARNPSSTSVTSLPLADILDRSTTYSDTVTPRALRYARRSGSLVTLDPSLAASLASSSNREQKPRSSSKSSQAGGTTQAHRKQSKSATQTEPEPLTPVSVQRKRRRTSSSIKTSVSSVDQKSETLLTVGGLSEISEPPAKQRHITKRTRSQSLSGRQRSAEDSLEGASGSTATSSTARGQSKLQSVGDSSQVSLVKPKKKPRKSLSSSLVVRSTVTSPLVDVIVVTQSAHGPASKKSRKSSRISVDSSSVSVTAASTPVVVASTSDISLVDTATRRGRRRSSVKRDIAKSNKEGGLTANGRPADTTGSCASSRRRSAVGKHNAASSGAAGSLSTGGSSSTSGLKLSAMSSTARDDGIPTEAGNSQLTAAIAEAGRGAPPQLGDVGHDPEMGAIDSAVAASAAAAASAVPGSFAALLEQDTNDVGRLQALLEARGLPSHLFGALGPRMHQLLLRSSIGGSVGRAQQLLQGLQSKDEAQQVTAVMEMCQLLVMGNEDTLAGFPMKQVVPALITLLQMEHNFDIMHHACRALTYMMEALPRSSAVVVDAVPVFLEKLQAIQCMDVAEQALQALEMLSKKHNKAILHANGVLACLTYVDFFSLPAQRNALAVTANCCQNLTAEEFHYVQDSLPLLSARLTSSDKKSLESVCLCMARLVDNYHLDEKILKEIAGHSLLANIQQLLMMSPQVLSSGIFVTVIRMLVLMCSHCPDLAVVLLKQNVAETLCYLLVGPSDQGAATQNVELVQRTPQELYEIVSLIGELMPKLPSDGLFAIDSLLRKPTSQPTDAVAWLWVDDHGLWHPYSVIDSRIIEAAHQSGEHEVNLSIFGGNYTIDFDTMQQINDDTGNARHVQRKANMLAGPNAAKILMVKSDSREEILHEDCRLASTFIKTLFSVLYEVYSSSAGPSVRHKCLQAIMRMIYYASPDLLNTILASSNVSSHVAAMMASPDLKIVVASIQMANILMDKLPNVFGVYFCREGVMHQIKKLCEPEVIDLSAKKTNATATTSSTSLMSPLASSLVPSAAEAGATVMASEVAAVLPGSSSAESLVPPAYSERMLMSDAVFLGPSSSSPDSFNSGGIGKAAPGGSADGSSGLSSPRMRLSSVLKHKKPLKRGGGSSGRKPSKSDPVPTSSSATTSAGMDLYSAVGEPFMVATVGRGTSPATDVTPPPPRGKWSSASMGKSSFLSGLHPSRWGRASSMGPDRPVPPVPATMGLSHLLYHEPMMTTHHHMSTAPPTCPNANVVIDNREKIKQWISEQATKFSDKYYGTDSHGSGIHPAMNNLNQLCTALSSLTASNGLPSEVSSLQLIAGILTDTDMSPFEMIHSGLVGVFLSYLTISDTTARDDRLRRFLQVFLGQQVEEAKSSLDVRSCNIQPFSAFVSKLMNCFHHLEQFQVKVHDLPGGSGTPGRSSNALKFFDTHQLKCNLQRHVSCTNLKQWHGGPVKIDPLALVQAIERYLVMRGYGRIRQNADNDCSDDDDGSDDDIDDTMAAMSISHGTGRHRIELLINDHVLPYGMTVYEAVKQFSNLHDRDGADTDTDTETPFGSAAIWINTHTIWFRSVSETDRQPDTGSSPRKMKSDRRRPASKSHRGGSSNDSSDSCVTRSMSALEAFLMPSLPSTVTIKDPSLEVLALLRLLHGINCHWNTLFDKAVGGDMLISAQEFVSSKLTAKANRQLQDPLVIMTGNMPQWLTQIARACPFLLPFDTRLSLFYATSFDRDRAMHRLQDAAHENAPSDSSDRVTPRLERKKSMISREDILKQAEKVLSDIGGSRAILEIQYENEVGTGLGPTLEFYALVSRELQRVDLDMWRGEVMQSSKSAKAGGEDVPAYMFNASGLFPSPLARNAKVASVNKIKSKFRLLGKFMAKALMDSRMLDLPLSEVFYKWMLGCEPTLQADDLRHICPVFAESFAQLRDVLRQKKCIEADKSHTTESRHLALSSLTLNGGGTVEDLDLDFVLPGYPNIELKKGGKDIHVTLDNLEEYLRLVTRWTLVEGTQRQFEAFREGFESLFPLSTLSLFYPSEMDQLFCGSSYEPWSIKYLMESCRPDHGYTLDSQAIRFLFEILSVYNGEEQRQFLQFMTGSPRLPVGGLKSLNPPLTIVRKTVEANENADDFLPSVMTCVNYLKLPDYTNIAIMRARLATAASEGQLSFHLS